MMAITVQAQTSKQAKASYKARGRPTVSEAEAKQLLRSVELEQRADRIREQEKRKAEAAKKRLQKEKRERAEQQHCQLGSQRRCDRFGYKSSQFHLGAFLKIERPQITAQKKSVKGNAACASSQDCVDFIGDDDVDDETMLSLLDDTTIDGAKELEPSAPCAGSKSCLMLPPPPLPHFPQSIPGPRIAPIEKNDPAVAADDFSLFWDALDSSTQIARELGDERHIGLIKDVPQCDSSDSESFDITAEDLEIFHELGSTICASMPEDQRTKARSLQITEPHIQGNSDSVLKEGICTPFRSLHAPTDVDREGIAACSSTVQMAVEVTMSQLERLVEDDIELSQ